jgi:hypothetical protein
MIVVEQYIDIKTGLTGRRLVERPDVLTEAEAVIKQATDDSYNVKVKRVAELREIILEALIRGAEVDEKERQEYVQLSAEVRE